MKFDYDSQFHVAARSYLVPWFDALQLSRDYEAVHESGVFISIDQQRVHALFGSLKGYSFESWWHAYGQEMFSKDCTRINASYAMTASLRIKNKGIFYVPHDMSIGQALKEFGVLLKRIDLLEAGKLSTSPHLWPTFKTRVRASTLRSYLDVLVEVRAQGKVVKGTMTQVGQQMRLVPKSQVRYDDLGYIKKEKRKHTCQVTSSYYRKALLLVENAALGVFPSMVKPKVAKRSQGKTAAAKSKAKAHMQLVDKKVA